MSGRDVTDGRPAGPTDLAPTAFCCTGDRGGGGGVPGWGVSVKQLSRLFKISS